MDPWAIAAAVISGGVVAIFASWLAHLFALRQEAKHRRRDAAIDALDGAVAAVRVFCAEIYFDALMPVGTLRKEGLIAAQGLMYADTTVIPDKEAFHKVLTFAETYVWSFEHSDPGRLAFISEVMRRLLWTGDREGELRAATERLIDAQRRIVESARTERARLLD